ncbi:hypothetical protein C1903_02835 [Listeria ivanovii]|nr:hypothetical protein C1905_02905 [Listeria ivanovii]PZF95890.1 hypothetical protein C1903_02835 [Listeria ivanovii]PZG06140.1 hypothetical protein C2L88_02830 [Listeria ivanovii]PZG11077.1 hypothetical protein C1901_03295 [Listeria ivanovii]PZG28028.1 hypothetical protein C1900_02910 [Listeria ivanovii]
MFEKNLNDDQKRFFHSYVSVDRKKKVKTLSLGQRKIVAILIAVLRNSQLLVLDEISNGLDIDNASKIKTLLCECKKKMIILSCGHQLDFHSDILDNALIINKKTITFVGENHNLEDVYESISSSSKERTLLSI